MFPTICFSRYFGPIFLAGIIACAHSPLRADATPEQGNKPLVMGVFPIVSGGALFKRFAPLKDYLARELGRDMILETAKDFPSFVARTAERRYDIVFTAPHFSLLATDSGDYQIVARPKSDLTSFIVVQKASEIRNISQLSGKLIATPPAPALTTRSGKDYLTEMGLQGARTPRYLAYQSHNAAYQAVLANDAVAAIVSNNIVNKALNNGTPLRVIDKIPPMPAMATLVATNQGEKLANDVRTTLVNMEHTRVGQETLEKVGFPGYLSATVKDYELVRRYKPANANIRLTSENKK